MRWCPAILWLLLATLTTRADVFISEFMANNATTLTDEDGDYSDWIEIHNSGTNAVNLLDWGLTDTASKPFKWQFPATNLPPNGYLVVFASNKDRQVAGAELHTNFKLDAAGEYLALVRPDGSIATQFAPTFPPQVADVAFGLSADIRPVTLLTTGAVGRVCVPLDGALGTSWTTDGFNDSTWTVATNGIGFETGASELGASLTEDIMADSPVGYWRLNGPTYTTMTNSGSLGAAANGTWNGDVQLAQPGALAGDANTAMRSPGTPGAKGTVPFNAALNPATSFSVEFWMKSEVASGSALAPFYSRCGDDGYITYIQNDGSLQFYQWTGTTYGWQSATTGPNTMRGMTNKWVHIACVFNSGVGAYGTQYIYTNGVLAGVNALPTTFLNHTCGPFLIAYPPLTQNYQGGLDEMAVYGSALSAARVAAHFRAGTNSAGNYVATVQADAPLAWWRFGEPAIPPSPGLTANTGSLGAAGNGTLSGGVTSGTAPMIPPVWSGLEAYNTCASFNGGDGQMTVPYAAALNPAAFTIEFWARCTDSQGNYRGVLSDNWTSGDYTRRTGWNFYAASGNFWQFNLADGADFTGLLGLPVVLGEWIHLAGTFDGAQMALYANGVLMGTNVTGFQPNTNSAAVLHIGSAATWDGGWLAYFPGDLDEVALFNRALTADEIARRYQVARNGKVAGARNYTGLIQTDLQTAMFGANSSAYFRLPFVVTNLAGLSSLKLRVKYDDGFVAWLNGLPVASANSPDNLNAPGVLSWDSAAVARSDTADAVQFEEFDLTPWQSALQTGTNILALQGLNYGATNTDFLLLAELEADYAGAYGTNGVYLLPPTPGGLNGSGMAVPGPAISFAGSTPALPTASDNIVVTCRVAQVLAPVASVTLNWRVMYGAANQTPMFDDGAHGDGAAGDGIFGATIPKTSYAPGQMVRWFITAADTTNRLSRWPLFLDPLNSPEYLGTMIADPSVVSALPIWYWFAVNPSAGHTRTGTRCSVFFNGEFHDNIFARERGQATQTGAQKFDFNSGDHCQINNEVGQVKQVNLNANGSDPSYMRQSLAFDVYRAAGQPASVSFPMLLRLNAGADRVGIYAEEVDSGFLARLGLDGEGALYKMINRITLTPMFTDPMDGVEKKTRLDEDRSDFQAACDALQQMNNIEARAAWMFDNFNLAGMVNMMACRTLVSDSDDNRKNMYFYRDTRGSGEWTSIPWDKDWTFGAVTGDVHPFRADYAHEAGGANHEQWSYHYEALFNDPRTRQMVVRRMRTVMDQQLQPPGTANGYLESRVDYYFNPAAPHLPGISVAGLKSAIATRRTQLYVNYAATNLAAGANALIPQSQPTNVLIGIGAIDFNPASGNQDEEFVQLVNTNTIAVDISGWKLGGGVQHTFAPGTVILPKNVMYCSPNVVAFRARAVSPKGGEKLFVQGNYNGHLSARGESLTLTDDRGRLVATSSFAPAPSDVQRYLRVTEIMYNPSPAPAITNDAQQFEFIELKNTSTSVALNLNNVRFTAGIAFNFTGSALTNLAPGQSVLLVRNLAAFTARYSSGLPIAGQFTGALDNAGESLRIEDALGEKVLEFAYNNSWYPITDGLGFSLVIVKENAPWDSWGDPASWRASGSLNGSPGVADPVPRPVAPIRVNEALAHTDPPEVDTIELFNPTATNVDLGGWFLTDDFFTPKKYRITGGTTIPAGGFLIFTTNQFGAGPNGFALSSLGEEVWLFAGDASTNLTGYYHGFKFGASPNGVSFGRYVNSQTNEFFVLQSVNTLGTNNAYPRVGPVVISEIMYHPPDLTNGVDNNLDEFIELQNLTSTSVALFDVNAATNTWRLRKAVDFDFPTNVSLAASARLLVVGFDPVANAPQLAAFRSRYAVATDVPVFGPWSGKLDNSGESIELQRPDNPNVTATNVTVPYYLVEAIDYRDAAPWPTNADGLGDSLQRQSLAAFGNDPTNWFSSTPTAGRANYPNLPPLVTLTAPIGGSLFQLPVNIVLAATASDPDGAVARVEFYDGAVKLGETAAQPYSFVWSNAAAGTHLVTARAVDDGGAYTTSATAAITVLTIPPTVSIASPADGAVFVTGQNLNVTASASDADGTVARVHFFANGAKIGESLAAPYSATQSNLASGLYLLSAVATDNNGRAATSAVVRVAFGAGMITNATLVSTGSVWRYFDKGSLPATNWFTAAYNDAGWSNGPAQLGYGDGDERTVVSYGGNAASKYPTTYFRLSVVITNAAEITDLAARLLRDDGGVVYINGVEAFRSNMPDGPIGYATWAATTISGAAESTFYPYTLPVSLLREGTNLIAVEIHQDRPDSSDISFDFDLVGTQVKSLPFVTANPASQSVTIGDTAVFAVSALGTEPLTYQWRHAGTNLPGRTLNPLVLANVSVSDVGNYAVSVANANGAVLSAAAFLSVLPIDADGNGLPDAWERQYFGATGVDPLADPDHDGLNNLREFLAGTDPTNAASVFRLESLASLSGTSFVFSFTAMSNHSYTAQYSPSLPNGAWTNFLVIPAVQSNRVLWLTNSPATDPARYYRLVSP